MNVNPWQSDKYPMCSSGFDEKVEVEQAVKECTRMFFLVISR